MNNTEKYTRPAIRDERTFHNIAMVLMIILALYCLARFPYALGFSIHRKGSQHRRIQLHNQEFSGSVRLSLDKEIHDRQPMRLRFGNMVVGTLSNLLLTSFSHIP